MTKFKTLTSAIFSALLLFTAGCSSENDTTETVTSSSGDLTIECLSLGSADSFIFITENSTVLIDTGLSKNYDDIEACLEQYGIEEIDAMILTHFDKDHIGSAAEIINNYSVDAVYTTYMSKESSKVDDLLEALDDNNIEQQIITAVTTLTIDNVTYTIYPSESQSYETKESNNSSLCILVQDGERSFLFPGDAEEERIEELLTLDNISCDVLKMPHHGRYKTNLEEFLIKVTPTYALITSSEDEPADDSTIELLEELNIETYLLMNGNVTIKTDGTSLSVTQQ